MGFVWAFLKNLFPAKRGSHWLGLAITYGPGIGIWAEWKEFREWLGPIMTLPETPSLWWLIAPFFIWAAISLAWHETKRQRGAARLYFDEPVIESNALRNQKTFEITSGPFQYAWTAVRNIPLDQENAKNAEDARAVIHFWRADNDEYVAFVEAPRWEDNPQPPYPETGAPRHRYTPEQKRRTLIANGEPNRITLAIKYPADEFAYGLAGETQITHNADWRNPAHAIPSGNLIMKVEIRAKGMTTPSVAGAYFSFSNGGAGGTIEIKPMKVTRWREENLDAKKRAPSSILKQSPLSASKPDSTRS